MKFALVKRGATASFLFSLMVLVIVSLSVLYVIVDSRAVGVVFYVTTTGSDANGCTNNTTDACATVQRAHDVASADDIVEVAAGTYTISSTITITKDIDIRGATSNYDDTVLDRNYTGRLMEINTTGTQTLSNFRIQRGQISNGDGAGLLVTASSGVVLDNMRFYDNRLPNNLFAGQTGGGGVWVNNGATVTVQNGSRLDHNFANYFGGFQGTNASGIAIGGDAGSTITITDSTIDANTTPEKGAIYSESDITITNSTIANNTCTGLGGAGNRPGGLHVNGSGTVIVTDSTFSGNSSPADGGGAIDIYGFSGTATFDGLTITGNTGLSGGGINIATNVTGGTNSITINDSIFTNNTVASGVGGGLSNQRSGGTTLITNSLFSGNSSSSGLGGGIGGHRYTMYNSTVSGNTGVGVFTTGGVVNISYSTIYNNAGGNMSKYGVVGAQPISNSIVALPSSGTNCPGAIASGGYNIFWPAGECAIAGTDIESDPLVNALADNGGPTQTHATTSASPARGGADPSCTVGGVPTEATCPSLDQRGVSRPQGSFFDIGSFEAEDLAATPVITSTVLSDTTISDGESMDVSIGLSEVLPVGEGIDSGQGLPGLQNGDVAYYVNGLIQDSDGESDFFFSGTLALTTYLNDGIVDGSSCLDSGTDCYINNLGTVYNVDPLADECALSEDAAPGNDLSDDIIAFSCRFDFEHYTMSTDISGVTPTADWAVYAVATDATATDSAVFNPTAVYEVASNLAGSVTSGNVLGGEADLINYSHSGILFPQDISTHDGTNDSTSSYVDNGGNVQLTLDVGCGAMSGTGGNTDTISENQQQFGIVDFTYDTVDGTTCELFTQNLVTLYGALEEPVKDGFFTSSVFVNILNLDIDGDLDDNFQLFWKIKIPSVRSDTYTGTNSAIMTQYSPP